MAKVFAASDHHFYHKNIIKYANRPFDFNDENCVIDNAKLMIHRHNKTVQDDDIVLIVGDLSAGLRGRTDHFKQLIRLLKGRKILVRGNHDHMNDDFYMDAGFIDVVDYIMIPPYFISHYQCFETQWSKYQEKNYIKLVNENKCTHIIHGHIHNQKSVDTDDLVRTNVCVDYSPNNYYPIELTQPEIKEYLFKKYS